MIQTIHRDGLRNMLPDEKSSFQFQGQVFGDIGVSFS